MPDSEGLIRGFWDISNDPKRTNVNILPSKDVFVQKVDGDHIVAINIPRADRSDKPVYADGNPLCTYRYNVKGDYRCTREEFCAMERDASVKARAVEKKMPPFKQFKRRHLFHSIKQFFSMPRRGTHSSAP